MFIYYSEFSQSNGVDAVLFHENGSVSYEKNMGEMQKFKQPPISAIMSKNEVIFY